MGKKTEERTEVEEIENKVNQGRDEQGGRHGQN